MRKSKKILEIESKFGSDLGDLLKKLYIDEKKTTVEISGELGTHISNIHYYLKNYNIPVRTRSEIQLRGRQKPGEDQLRQLYVTENKTLAEIGKTLGFDVGSVSKWLKEYSIPVRSISEALLRGKQKPSGDQLRQLYITENKSASEIGKIVSVSSNCIIHWLKEYKISIRTGSEIQLKGKKIPSKEQLIQLYQKENKSTVEIGELFDINSGTVSKYLKKYEIPVRTILEANLKGKPKPSEDQLRQLYLDEGKSTTEIGELLGISTTTIYNYLIDYKIPVRNSSEAQLNGKQKPTEDQLRKLYVNENKSTVDIGKMFGLSNATIIVSLREYDIPIRNNSEAKLKGKKKPSKEQLIQLYQKEHKSAVKIGEIFGIYSSTVGRYLRNYEITINRDSSNELKRQALERVLEAYLK